METERKSAKHRADRWTAFYLTILLVSWLAASWFLYLSMGGGFRGIFLNWCLGILLLVPIGCLIRNLVIHRPSTPVRLTLGIFALIGLVPLSLRLIGDLVMTWRSNPVHDLGGLPANSRYTRTRFEFHKDAVHFVIRDPGNRLRFCFGAVPAAIRVEDGERIVVFDDWVILKSWTFDYGFEGETINYGGWMGSGSNEPELEIGPDGMPMPRE